jgi:predicted dehydrogenase
LLKWSGTVAWKIGILGLIHDHIWTHVEEMNRRGDVQVSAADPNAPLREKARDEYGIDRLYDDPATLLETERPDAVLIFTDNAGTAALVELAASHGTPIMSEKPMADSLANAERMLAAAARADVPLMVNWPTWWIPAIRHAVHLAQDGRIGEIVRFNFRGGHAGPREFGVSPWFSEWLLDRQRNGGGAYIDYAGYGASLARLLLGQPATVQATIRRLRKHDIEVDDNAVLTLLYPQALAVIEATWTAAGPVPDGGPAIWGTTGSLVVHGRTGVHPGAVRLLTPENPDGEIIEPPALPHGKDNAIDYFLTCLSTDRPIEGQVNVMVSRDAQEILQAGLRAERLGSDIALPLDRADL